MHEYQQQQQCFPFVEREKNASSHPAQDVLHTFASL